VIIVVMGVAGSGKTRIGRALAEALGWPFLDADDFHSLESIERMRSGVALTDAHREPWLNELSALLLRIDEQGGNAVLACSALRAQFRERLRAGPGDVRFAYLRCGEELIAARLQAREDHFMPASLLHSQFDALEEPDDALTLDAAASPAAIVARIRATFAL
jgi:gluconokinase